MKEFKVWGGQRDENHSIHIWAKDADDAIEIARRQEPDLCAIQWTGYEILK